MNTSSTTPSIPNKPAPGDFAIVTVEHHNHVPLWAALTITVLIAVLAAVAAYLIVMEVWT